MVYSVLSDFKADPVDQNQDLKESQNKKVLRHVIKQKLVPNL